MSFSEVADLVERGGYRVPSPLNSHGAQRAALRYGLYLDKRAYEEIRRRIMEGEAVITREESVAVVEANVSYGGRTLPVVYDRLNNTIITVLSPT